MQNLLEVDVEGNGDIQPAAGLVEAPDDDSDNEPDLTSDEKSLFEAIVQGNLETVQALVEQQVNINCSSYGFSVMTPDDEVRCYYPLLTAASFGQFEILKCLVKAKADLCVFHPLDGHVFEFLFSREIDCPEITEFLMQALEADPQAWSNYSSQYWWGDAIVSAASSGKDESLRVLLWHLENYTQNRLKEEQDKLAFKTSYLKFHSGRLQDQSILSIVCKSKKIKQGHLILIQAGADIQSRNDDGQDALCCLVSNPGESVPYVLKDLIGIIKNDKEYFKKYLASGGFIQVLKAHLFTRDHFIFTERFQAILEILINELKEESSGVDLYRYIPSKYNMKNSYEANPDYDPLFVMVRHNAFYGGDSLVGPQILHYLIRHGAAIDRQYMGKTPLQEVKSILLGQQDDIKNLADQGHTVPPDKKNKIRNLQTVMGHLENAEKLMDLCKGGLRLEVEQAAEEAVTTLNQLVAAGVSVNQVDRDNRTPLYYAVASGQEQLVQALISLSANPHYDCCPDAVVPVIPSQTPLILAKRLANSPSRARIYLTLVEKTVSLETKETKETEEISSLAKWHKIENYVNKDFMDDTRKNLIYFIMGKRLKYEVSTSCEDKEKHSINYLSFKCFSAVQETSPYFKEAAYEIAGLLLGGCLELNDQDEIIDPLVEEQSLDTSIVSLDQNPQSSVEPKLALDLKPSSLNGSKPPAIMQNVKVAFVYAMRAQGCHEEARRLRENIIAEMIGLKWGGPHRLNTELEGPKVLVETRLIESLFSRIRELQNNCEVLQNKCEVLQDKCEVLESSVASSPTTDLTSTPLLPPSPTSSDLMSAPSSPSAMVPQFGEERHRKKRDREEGSSASSGRSTKYSCR